INVTGLSLGGNFKSKKVGTGPTMDRLNTRNTVKFQLSGFEDKGLCDWGKMSKKLNNMKWESVALDGFPASMTDRFQGFVGLEECTDYSFDKEGKGSKKNKKKEKLAQKREQKKRKSSESETKEVPSKKVKLDNGFVAKQRLGDLPKSTSELTREDMLTWAEFKDILGAAETGSGKTLAFGLPILCGILKLKEKAELKGLDVYDIPYRKPALKKKEEPKEKTQKFKRKDRKGDKKKIVQEEKVKESSEDGYSSGKESDEEGTEDDLEEGTEDGVGCVKVVDNIEIPGHVSVKTGKPLYALILTPTRELAIQISRHLIAAAKYTGIKVATIVGGMAAVKQERVLRSGPEIVVATPGRLWELIGQGQPHLQQLDSVKFLAIDETDRMIERGHFEELTPLLERLNADEERKAARQNFVFSATLTMVHDLPTHMKGKKVTKHGKIINRKIEKMTPQQKVNRLIKMIGMTEPKVVDITTQNLGTAETLTESRITCALEHKDAYLYYIVKRHPGRTIVFCNSIGSVKRLAQLFTLLKCRPLPLHASMPQRQRIKNLERFRDDPHGVLIATDVAARGLDIPHVEHVIHYQVPRTAENYVHRSGRTARASREGLTILMMDPSEAYLYTKMCRTLNKTSEVPTFPVDSQVLAPIKELMVLARELDALELKKRRAAQAHGWKERAAREMDIIIDDDDLPVKQVNASIDKELKTKRRQLESLLSRPIYPRGFSFKYPTLNNDTTVFQGSEENALQNWEFEMGGKIGPSERILSFYDVASCCVSWHFKMSRLARSASVICTVFTACCMLVVLDPVTSKEWPNPDEDPLIYIDNPVESQMPGHWVPQSIVREILKRRTSTAKPRESFITIQQPKVIQRKFQII
ncbi:hypothetical protein HW555_003297, partial [Spodoptera exigua]